MKFNLLPISYWQEFLDMIFFFKVATGTVRVSPSFLLQVLVTGTTRSNSSRNVTHFISRKCNSVTFQRSFLTDPPESGTCSQMTFDFHAMVRSVNSNPSCMDALELNYDKLKRTHDPGKPFVRRVTFQVTSLNE